MISCHQVTTSISLTTTSKNVNRRAVDNSQEEEPGALRELHKVPSLGKVIRSKLLMEKLNKFVSKKKGADLDYSEDVLDNFSGKKSTLKEVDVVSENSVVDDSFKEEALNFSELTNISEEGEFDEETPNSTILESQIITNKMVPVKSKYCEDVENLNLTQGDSQTKFTI